MCDCVPSTLPTYPSITIPNSGFTTFNRRPSTLPIPQRVRNGELQFISTSFRSNGSHNNTKKWANSIKVSSNSTASGSNDEGFYRQLGLKEEKEKRIELGEEETKEKSSLKNGIDMGRRFDDGSDFPSVDFLGFDEMSGTKTAGRLKDEELVQTGGSDSDGGGFKLGELEKVNLRRGRQIIRRSNMIAKQVISMRSALNLGFISQLWVDTNSWVVLIVEVRPNLLSGELERLLLEDISQVGDVVLIQDESMMENEFKMVGLDTLVGYNVVTPGRQKIGKVRGYTFNINSGVVELLELDSFGISIIPSSLVSTYALFVEDVLEVVSDTVVVHEAAASRIQRLTKGFWDAEKLGNSIDELADYSDLERQPVQSDDGWGRRRKSASRKPRPKMRDIVDDWELPMDFL